MKKRILILSGALLAAYFSLVVIAWHKPPAGRKEWIEIQSKRLNEFSPESFDELDVGPNEGHDELYRFKDGGWIYTISHCSHFVDMNKILVGKSGVDIGDVTVAIDYRGNTYYSESHACGSIYLDLEDNEGVLDLSHFFKCTEMHWRQIIFPNQWVDFTVTTPFHWIKVYMHRKSP